MQDFLFLRVTIILSTERTEESFIQKDNYLANFVITIDRILRRNWSLRNPFIICGFSYFKANTTVTSYFNFIFLKSACGWSFAD